MPTSLAVKRNLYRQRNKFKGYQKEPSSRKVILDGEILKMDDGVMMGNS